MGVAQPATASHAVDALIVARGRVQLAGARWHIAGAAGLVDELGGLLR